MNYTKTDFPGVYIRTDVLQGDVVIFYAVEINGRNVDVASNRNGNIRIHETMGHLIHLYLLRYQDNEVDVKNVPKDNFISRALNSKKPIVGVVRVRMLAYHAKRFAEIGVASQMVAYRFANGTEDAIDIVQDYGKVLDLYNQTMLSSQPWDTSVGNPQPVFLTFSE